MLILSPGNRSDDDDNDDDNDDDKDNDDDNDDDDDDDNDKDDDDAYIDVFLVSLLDEFSEFIYNFTFDQKPSQETLRRWQWSRWIWPTTNPKP